MSLPDPLRQLDLLSLFSEELKANIKHYAVAARPYEPNKWHQLEGVPDWASMSLHVELRQQESSYELLRTQFDLQDFDSKKAILLFPGSVWATKRWATESYIKLGQTLQKLGHPIYVMGGPGEEELAEQVHRQIPESKNWAGRTKVWESAQLICRAALLVGNDSASTHLAAVCETPVVTIFGPTVLRFGFRPWSNQAYVHQNERLSCRPCGRHGHQVCPLGTHECMRSIHADEVAKTVEHILSQASRR